MERIEVITGYRNGFGEFVQTSKTVLSCRHEKAMQLARRIASNAKGKFVSLILMWQDDKITNRIIYRDGHELDAPQE